jgi:hypothetical protein
MGQKVVKHFLIEFFHVIFEVLFLYIGPLAKEFFYMIMYSVSILLFYIACSIK